MRRSILSCSCLLLLLTGKIYCQNMATDEQTPLLRLYYGQMAVSEMPESSMCLVVHGSDEIYIEKRTQADLKVYEGMLTDSQLDDLHRLLANNDLSNISDEVSVYPPATRTDLSWITAYIRRGSSVQPVGYRYWKDQSAEYLGESPSFVAEETERLKVLTPLVNWARAIDVNNLQLADFKSGMCSRFSSSPPFSLSPPL